MPDRTPVEERALTDAEATPWSTADERLANPERPRTYWLATVRPDGRPHLMPIIGLWMDGRLYFVCGEATRKGRNLLADGRCVVATGSTRLPSLDLILEGDAAPVTDDATLRRVTDAFVSRMEWPLEVRDGHVHGPNAPTAGAPPYAVFGMTPATAFGLPGMYGMEEGRPNLGPTRWKFDRRDAPTA
jgi:hypothetical protein